MPCIFPASREFSDSETGSLLTLPSCGESVSRGDVAFVGREPQGSRGCARLMLAARSAATRRVFRYRANRRQYLCRAIFQYRGAAEALERAGRKSSKRGLVGFGIGRCINSAERDIEPRLIRHFSPVQCADRAVRNPIPPAIHSALVRLPE